jgi:Na+-transporting NADH:ubiquinone oxidoreductase subunit B
MVQKPMTGTTLALVPCALFGIYNFGWRALAVIAVSLIVGFATEAAFTLRQGKPVTSAVFVSAMLFGLIMPPSVPLWIVAVGIAFAVTFGKMVFGGFGQNPYNPAMVGRCFVYISFPIAMTAHWNEASGFFPRGLDHFLVDAMTTATPMVAAESGQPVELWRALFGFTGGSIGETSFILVALGGAYVIYKKWANWRTVLATALFAVVPQTILWLTGASPINPLYMILTGGFGLGVFFMATDPVSSPRTNIGRWVYGAIIGICTVIIRTYGNFAEGFMFALLLGNTFAPIVDYTVQERQKAKKPAAQAKGAQEAGS